MAFESTGILPVERIDFFFFLFLALCSSAQSLQSRLNRKGLGAAISVPQLGQNVFFGFSDSICHWYFFLFLLGTTWRITLSSGVGCECELKRHTGFAFFIAVSGTALIQCFIKSHWKGREMFMTPGLTSTMDSSPKVFVVQGTNGRGYHMVIVLIDAVSTFFFPLQF